MNRILCSYFTRDITSRSTSAEYDQEYIIVTIFSNSFSLGLLRLKIAEVVLVLEKKLPKREV